MRSVVVLSYRAVFVRETYWYIEKYFATPVVFVVVIVVIVVIVIVAVIVVAAAVIVCVETFQFYLRFEKLML
jgi:ABC-type multidrug transport system permease subunit